MISSWQIYWVMQLDSISNALTVVSVALLIAAIVAAFKYSFAKEIRDIWDDYPDSEQFKREDSLTSGAAKVFKRSCIGAAIAMCIAAFIPSSKTAAAMIVIPAIANNEKFQAEASELYDLAKSGLKKLVTEEPKKNDP